MLLQAPSKHNIVHSDDLIKILVYYNVSMYYETNS